MMKLAILAGTMIVATPALAQETPPSASIADPVSESVPATAGAPASSIAQTAPAPAASDATATASAQPASGDQVAAVVTQEFPAYDKDSNGSLSKAEFAAWMVTLKQASDPSAKADSAATKTWLGSAFAQADADKSKTISQSELTGFLSLAQS